MSQFKVKFGPDFLNVGQVNANNGVAGLDGSGKILTSVIPAGALGGLSFKGTFDASGGSYPSSPSNGDFYIVSVAGTVSGTALKVGDYIFYYSTGTTWEVIHDPSTTDQLTEGSTNLYFTNTRAQTAAVLNTLGGSQTNQAPSVASVNTALALKATSFTRIKEIFTLASGDITNGYIVVSHLALSGAMIAGVQGLGMIFETDDYTLSVDGVSGNTKLTWVNDLASGGATPLASGDKIYTQYVY